MAKQSFRIFCVASVAIGTLFAPRLAPAQQSPAPRTTIGDFSIAPWGHIETRIKKNGDYEAKIVGINGRPVVVNSPSYDLTAPRIEITLVGKKLKPTSVLAVGSTKIVNRNRETGQKTIITCDEMRFTASARPDDRGVMRLTGNVRSETQDKRFAAPLILTGDTGTAAFADDGEVRVTMNASGNRGTLSGRIYEPPAKPKGKQP